jgi:hypothetical protein
MRTLALALLLAAAPAAAQMASAPERPTPIQDNSFLVEEAYNQEGGVVQHMNTFHRASRGGDWEYAFVQEWPLFSQRHQVGFTLPVTDVGGGSGVGDLSLDYRLQLLGSGETPLALAPRLSLLLPTSEAGRGADQPGLQLNLPLSVVLSPSLVAHSNAGATRYLDTDDAGGSTDLNLGQSLVWLAHPRLNLLLEGTWERTDLGGADADDFTVAPGVRGAIDFASGLQVVPGVAVPVRVGPGESDWSVFLYLSLEHPFGRR